LVSSLLPLHPVSQWQCSGMLNWVVKITFHYSLWYYYYFLVITQRNVKKC
jgi:hypothetical protein